MYVMYFLFFCCGKTKFNIDFFQKASLFLFLLDFRMSFFTSPCSPIYRIDNISVYKNLIALIIISQILIVVFLVIFSILKNHQNVLKKQNKQLKNSERNLAASTSNNLKTQGINTNNTINGRFKSGKSLNDKKIMYIQNDCKKLPTFESISLKNKVKQKVSIDDQSKKEVQGQFSQEKQKQSSLQEEKSVRFKINNEIQEQVKLKKYKKVEISDQKQGQNYFIKIGNLQISQDKSSMYFNLFLSHFFVSATLSIQVSPELTSFLLSSAHIILFIYLLVINIFLPNQNKNNHKRRTQTNQNEQNVSIDGQLNRQMAMIENEVQVKREIQQKNYEKFKVINLYFSIVFFMIINLSLLCLSVIRIKSSYLNLESLKCQ